ncbi:MAG: dihydroorotate dehydrogenase [Desulfuromonadales bacterium C00003096]|jgi:dihydroorotate dehydrogenase electron transfer subunit|nr:MAG: dihydroorotate dehydrogenase [Desulfuromonadales bacterium C00003096]
MKNFKTTILSNQEVSPEYYRMKILAPGISDLAQPGQFVMFRSQSTDEPLLRRPFGIFQTGTLPSDCDGLPDKEFVEILYKVVGRGTSIMRELHEGDRVELLGPLGRGFELGDDGREQILVGGGIGLVPLYMLASELVKRSKVRLLIGGRSRKDVLMVTEFERLGVETYVSTDDGTLGEEGQVTQVLERKLNKFPEAAVYACGPMPMLEAVSSICQSRQVALQVSLEAFMACGVGACLGCVVKGAGHSEQQPRYLCTCKEGPVFRAEELEWELLEKRVNEGGHGHE